MVIADAIREAETAYVVYFLVEAYLNTESRRNALKSLSSRIAALPLTGKYDAKSRCAMLKTELDSASTRRDDKTCVIVKEALSVFGAAVQRLEVLEMQRTVRPPLANGFSNDSIQT
ncbi:MAG: hypothetical protein JWN94_1194 [Betaproteobacteria bacterium]|nr:hypothetical protein [Betaproteobacteria bacterium]